MSSKEVVEVDKAAELPEPEATEVIKRLANKIANLEIQIALLESQIAAALES